MNKLICYNCNGLGEKTRSRGPHSSIHRTTKCYTCMGSGELELTIESFKNSIIHHLDNLNRPSIKTDIHALWGEVKSWCENKHHVMGGSYASYGKEISVIIKIDPRQFRFPVAFSELK